MNQADTFGSLLLQTPTLAFVVWALTEALGNLTPGLKRIPQQTVALIFGPACGMLGYYLGWIGEAGVTGAKGWIGSAFIGLAATLIAGLAHDKVAAALMPSKIAESFRKSGP